MTFFSEHFTQENRETWGDDESVECPFLLHDNINAHSLTHSLLHLTAESLENVVVHAFGIRLFIRVPTNHKPVRVDDFSETQRNFGRDRLLSLSNPQTQAINPLHDAITSNKSQDFMFESLRCSGVV